MLYKFLERYRIEILALAEEKISQLAGPLLSSEELRQGLPIFFELLIDFLRNPIDSTEKKMIVSAAQHGKELLRLNYTLSHVVHSYGAMCQAITELAQRKKSIISAQEFNDLNLCLDVAIASAVTEFQFHSVHASEEREVQHLGFLAHELRNALSSATVAQDMIRQGLVGMGGSTAKVLEENLTRMRIIIDRSLSEIRMRTEPEILVEKFRLNELVDQILLTSQFAAQTKKQVLKSEVMSMPELETDRQLLLSAIANLVQNALKYTKMNGHITLSAKAIDKNVVIEIHDECGGLDPNWIKNLFKPFASGGGDQSGLGLGLTIVRRAVSLLQGKISVHNNPGEGCSFRMEIPTKLGPLPLNKAPVAGKDSVQPRSKKKKV